MMLLNRSAGVIAGCVLLFSAAGRHFDGSPALLGASRASGVSTENRAARGADADVSSRPPAADLVIENATVVTIDRANPRAEAVAFKGETIVAVTTNRAIAKYVKDGVTQVIDARGRLVVPGFNDAHIHFNEVDPDYIDLRYITDPARITQKVKEAVAKARPGELIRGGRWEHETFHNKQWPTKELIDPVAPNNPVVLLRADGHSVLVNNYVIRHSGITRETPDPFGGEIQRDPRTGEPTGIFKETAKALLKYGQTTVEQTREGRQGERMRRWQAAFDLAMRNGVTSIQLPPGGDFDIYQQFKDMGRLTLRVTVGGSLTADRTSWSTTPSCARDIPAVVTGYALAISRDSLTGRSARARPSSLIRTRMLRAHPVCRRCPTTSWQRGWWPPTRQASKLAFTR